VHAVAQGAWVSNRFTLFAKCSAIRPWRQSTSLVAYRAVSRGIEGVSYYEVKQNETLPEVVAAQCPELSVEQVRTHEKNAKLFSIRDEYLLRTGDKIWIPDEEPKRRWFSVKAGGSHKFVVGQRQRPFQLTLRFPDGSAAANEDYELEIDGEIYTGTTDAEGKLDTWVRFSATKGLVKIDQFAQRVVIGGLEPITTVRGIQGRLANLGFMPGPVDGIVGPLTTAAITAFQHGNDLDVDGIAGPQTRAKLKEQYGK